MTFSSSIVAIRAFPRARSLCNGVCGVPAEEVRCRGSCAWEWEGEGATALRGCRNPGTLRNRVGAPAIPTEPKKGYLSFFGLSPRPASILRTRSAFCSDVIDAQGFFRFLRGLREAGAVAWA